MRSKRLFRCQHCGLQMHTSLTSVTCCRVRQKFPGPSFPDNAPPLPKGAKARRAQPAPKRLIQCAHLGDEIRRELCQSCKGKIEVKVLRCEVHGECTRGKPIGSVACCGVCYEYEMPAIETRNLIYHLCPLESNDIWKRNLWQLVKRWPVFNGRRIIAVATGQGMESPREVRRYLGGLDYEELLIPNDKLLREVATFLPLLEAVSEEPGATFYAHTKGNSTNGGGKNWGPGNRAVTWWRNVMYARLLDGADECMAHLRKYLAVGCHKLMHPIDRSIFPTRLKHGDWMFAGTFFWFRNDATFSTSKWRDVPQDRYGAEAWPGGMFDHRQAKSVYQKWDEEALNGGGMSPYDPVAYDEENRIEDYQ